MLCSFPYPLNGGENRQNTGTGRVPGIPLKKKGAVSLLRLSKSQRGIVVVSLTLGNGVEQLGKDQCNDREKSAAMYDLSKILQRSVYLTLALVEGLVERGIKLSEACGYIENYSSQNYSCWVPEKYCWYLFKD